MAQGRLVLWDLDGTLLSGGGTGAAIFDDALEQVTGARPPRRIAMSGMTDPLIVREYLAMMGYDPVDAEHLADAVLALLPAALRARAATLRSGGRAMPGVPALLERLDAAAGVVQSVLTGNLSENAEVKLEAFGLRRWLDLEIGAYGSDDPDRNALVAVALGRAAAVRGHRFGAEDVWIVGDAPADLVCARSNGARCALVATGRTGFADLEALGPDAMLGDLTDTEAVATLLCS